MVKIDGYQIDAAVNDTTTLTSEISDYPIEDGSAITDHVRRLPTEVQIEGLVSDTPIGTLLFSRGILDLPSEAFLAQLEKMHADGRAVTIETSLRTYTDMVMTSLTLPVDAGTGEALRFTARFRQIRKVTTARFEINVDLPRAKKRKTLGARAPEPTPFEMFPSTLLSDVPETSPLEFPGVSPLG